MRKGVFRLENDRLFEISNRVLVVAHILVNETALDVDCLVVDEQLLHPSELLECLMKFLGAPIHQTQVEHRRDERAAVEK